MVTPGAPVWSEGTPALALPRLENDERADVCVVGLGGSGLAAVLELLDRGKRVVAIDAGEVAGGAAGRNGGFLLAGMRDFYHETRKALGRERARGLYQLTRAMMDRMTAETPEAVRRVGSLRIAWSREELGDCREQLEAMRGDDLPVEWYAGPEGEGLLLPEDGAFDPLARCRALARRALAGGAQLYERTRALTIEGDRVETPNGVVRCDAVVVAVDGHLELLFPALIGRVRTARLQMLATAPTREVSLPRPVYARWGYEYWRQLTDGRLALGGFRDVGGDTEWTHDTAVTPPVQSALERLLRDRLGVTAPVTHRWAASVGYTPSGLPILEEVRPRVWVTGGYSGTGNVVGALCGRAAARLACSPTCHTDERSDEGSTLHAAWEATMHGK